MIVGADVMQTGRGTKLEPPVVIDGVTYSHAVVFETDCRQEEGARKLGEWQVHAVDGDWLILERGLQWASYVIPPEAPGRGSTEIVYPGVTGGNACNSRESERVYSPHNRPMAARGSLAGIRLIAGDGVRVVKGSKAPLLELVEIDAYGVPNEDGVNYGDQIEGLNAYAEPLGTELAADVANFPEGVVVEFERFGAGVSQWTGSGADTPVTMTRRIFNDDPEQMPGQFVLGAGEYFWNPFDYSVRLSNSIDESMPELFLVYWLMVDAGRGVDGEVGENLKVSANNGSVGYAGWGEPATDFNDELLMLGPGRAHCQVPGGRGVYLALGEDEVLESGYRTVDGAPWSDAEFGAFPSLTYPVLVRFRRDGERWRIDVGGVNVLDEAVGPKGGMVIGVGSGGGEGCQWLIANDGSERNFALFGEGEFGVRRVEERTLGERTEVRIPNGYVIEEVYNESAERVMSVGGGRSGYTISGGKVVLNRETEFDLVRVSLEAVGSGPAAPGFAFRTYEGQTGFSTIDEDAQAATGLPFATSNVNENRANWHDRIRVLNPFGVDVQPRDYLEGYRHVGFMPSDADASFEVDALGDEETTWTALWPMNYRWNGYAGVLLLDENLSLPDVFCVRGTFERCYRSGHHAEHFEEMKAGVEVLDEVHSTTGALGGGGIGFHGNVFQDFGPQSHALRTMPGGCKTWWPTDWVWGLSKAGVHGRWIYDAIEEEYRVKSMGYFVNPSDYRDLFLRTGPPGPSVSEVVEQDPGLICTPPYPVRESHWDFVPGEGSYNLDAFGPALTPISSFGSDYPFPDPDSSLVGVYGIKSAFADVVGRRVDPGKVVYRLPRGSTIVSASMMVKFNGLKGRVWTWNGAGVVGGSNDGDGWVQITCNGRTTFWNSVGDDYDGLGPPPGWEADSFLDFVPWAGQLTLDMVGARYDSRIVHALNNPAEPEMRLPTRRLMSGPGGIAVSGSSNVEGNQWQEIDVTRAFRALYSMNNSEVQELHLVPSIGQPTTSQHPRSLGNYMAGLMNSAMIQVVDDFPSSYVISGSASGQAVWFDDIDLGEALISYRIGTTGPVYQKKIPADWVE